MNLGTRKICPKGYKRNKTKKSPYDCIPNGKYNTSSPRINAKYYIINGTVEQFNQFIWEINYDPSTLPNYPGNIPKASFTRLIRKIEDAFTSNPVHVKIDRDDMRVLQNTSVGSEWLPIFDITYLERTKKMTPKNVSPLRPSPPTQRHPRSPRIVTKIYNLKSTIPKFKQLIKILKTSPANNIPNVSVKRLIKKVQTSIDNKLTTVFIDRDDLFVIDNIEECRQWNLANGNLTGVERSPVSVSPIFEL